MNAGKPLTRKTPLARGKAKARPMDVTHSHLVSAGAKWLADRLRCQVIVTEPRAGWRMRGESPDILGWDQDGLTVLVEVKVNRGDFLADAGKPWRRGASLGRRRYYLAPAGLIEEHEIPDRWGLLEYLGDAPAGCRICRRRWAIPMDEARVDAAGEVLALLAACRRLGVRSAGGVACRAFTIPTKLTTEVHVEDEAPAGEPEHEAVSRMLGLREDLRGRLAKAALIMRAAQLHPELVSDRDYRESITLIDQQLSFTGGTDA